MNKLYKNKGWLETKYIDEKLSDPKIAKLCNVGPTIIGSWRKRFNIDSRSSGEANHLSKVNHCNLSKKSMEWINGELLGDGSLQSHSNYSARILYGSSHFDYATYISETLKSFGIVQMGKINKSIIKINNYGPYFHHAYSSLNYEELLPIWKKWYPNGKKIVPRDVKLTPITVRQWYIGDGCLVPHNSGRSHIILCTEGFPISDVNWLVEQLNNLGFKATQYASNVIHISVYSTLDFLNYIGPCPIKDYEYKWKYYKKEVI